MNLANPRIFAAGLTALAATLALTACGNTSAGENQTESPADSAAATTDETLAAATAPVQPAGPSYANWEYGPIVLDSDEMDFLPVDPEAIALPDGRIRLFVDGVQLGQIRSYTTENGTDFVPDDVPPIQGTFPNVIALPDGRFRMYVTRFYPNEGPNGEEKVISLISDDALNWKEEKGFRTTGSETSAVTLKDGRTLLAVRRLSNYKSPWPCVDSPKAIWFAISDDGLKFEDVSVAVDGGEDFRLEGRAYGVEFARLANGELVMHFEGCLPAYFVAINEDTLELGERVKSPLRGQEVYDHYGFTENIGGAGGDITLLVKDDKDIAYVSLRDGPNAETSMDPSAKPPGVRQRIALVTGSDLK